MRSATRAIRSAVDHEWAQPSQPTDSPPLTEDTTVSGALEIVLDNNRISHQMREMLERPENYLRPVRIREYWRAPWADDAAPPKEVEEELDERALAR